MREETPTFGRATQCDGLVKSSLRAFRMYEYVPLLQVHARLCSILSRSRGRTHCIFPLRHPFFSGRAFSCDSDFRFCSSRGGNTSSSSLTRHSLPPATSTAPTWDDLVLGHFTFAYYEYFTRKGSPIMAVANELVIFVRLVICHRADLRASILMESSSVSSQRVSSSLWDSRLFVIFNHRNRPAARTHTSRRQDKTKRATCVKSG